MSRRRAPPARAAVIGFAPEELAEAARAIASTLGKCAKVLPKLAAGTSSHTLLVRRMRALEIAAALIERERSAGPATPTAARPPRPRRGGRGS